MNNKNIYHIELVLVWLGVIAGFAGVVIQLLDGPYEVGLVGALGGFLWPLTCLVLIKRNNKLKKTTDEE